LQLRPKAVPSLIGWGLEFVGNSSPARYECNTLKNLALALNSLETLQALRRDTGIEYGQAMMGSLRVFREPAALDSAMEAAERLRVAGLAARTLTRDETMALEPALAPIAHQLSGGIYYPRDETGNALKFCRSLADLARRDGVDFRFETAVSEIEVRTQRVTAVIAKGKRLTADRYVVAAGSYTPRLLAPMGIDIPVRPAKGYSITFDRHAEEPPLRIPIIDDDFHAAVVPVDDGIRVAGTAGFAGYDLSMPDGRIHGVFALLGHVLPRASYDRRKGRTWCGLRPMSADGVPIIGPTPIENLWVNTGHGHLGWTMAAGSARLLVDLMTNQPPCVNPEAYALARFKA
jgi:D-amino-acid dehydrogenase